MNNITELRNSLADNYGKVKMEEMDIKKSKELSNTAGKIIQTLNVELKYQALLGIKTKIKFLE